MSFSRPPFQEDRAGSMREQRTVDNTSSNVRPFKSRPLNEHSLPRFRFSERSPSRNQLHRLDKSDDVGAVLKKYRSKKLEEERDKRRDFKDRYKWKPQVGNAEIQSVDGDNASLPNKKTVEPQMFRNLFPSVEVSLSDDTQATVESCMESVERVSQTAANLMSTLKDVSQQIAPNGKIEIESRLDPTVASTIVNLSEFAMIVVIICLIIMLKPKTQVERALVLALLLGIAASRVDMKRIFDTTGILNWFKPTESVSNDEDKAVPQMFDLSQDDITTMVSSLLNIYVLQSFGTSIFEPKELIKVTQQISRMAPTVQNITAGVTLISSLLITTLRKALGNEGFIRTGTEYIDGFFKEYEEIVNQFESKELHMRQTSVDRVKACIAYGDNVARNLPGSPSKYVVIRMQAMQAVSQLQKIRTKLMSSNFLYTGHRQEPATLLLMGKPGVFKSQAMQHICNAVNALTLPDDQFERFRESPTTSTYTYQHENVYHEGYSQEKNVTLIDDFGQAKDIAGNPDNEYMNLIRMVNIFENILHMAGIENKGNTHFRSKFVIANSNLFTFSPESINDKMAILRRFHLAVIVRPKAEFCEDPDAPPLSRKFDTARFPVFTAENCKGQTHLIGHTRTHPDMCEFDVQQVLPNGSFASTGKILNFSELVQEYYKRYLWTKKNHEAYNVTLEDTLDHFRYNVRDVNRNASEFEPQSGRPESPLVYFRRRDMAAILADRRPGIDPIIPFAPNNPVTADYEIISPFVTDRGCFALNYVECRPYTRFPITLGFFELDEEEQHIVKDIAEDNYHPYFQTLFSFVVNFLDVDIGDKEFVPLLFRTIEDYYWKFHGHFLHAQMDPNRLVIKLNLADACVLLHYCYSEIVRYYPDTQFKGQYSPAFPICSIRDSDEKGKFWINILLNSADPRFRLSRLGEDGSRASPQMNHESESFYSIDGDQLLDELPMRWSYQLDNKRTVEMDTIRMNNWMKWWTFDCSIIFIGSRRKFERDELIDVNDLFDVMMKMDYESFEDRSYREFALAAEKLYDSRAAPHVYRPNMREIREKLALARSEATSFQGRLWSIYQVCVAYLVESSQRAGDAICGSLVESPTLRAKIAIFSGSLVGFATAIKAAQFIVRGLFPSEPHSDERSNRVGRSRRQVRRTPRTIAAAPQSLATQNKNVCNVIEMVSSNSMYEVHIPLDPEEAELTGKTHTKAGYCLAVKGKCMLMPWHFWSQVYSDVCDYKVIAEDAHVIFKRTTGIVSEVITAKEFINGGVMWKEGDNRDLILIRMPKRYQPVRNLIAHFAPEKQHSKYTKVNACLIIPGSKRDIWNVVTAQQDKDVIVGDDRFEDYSVLNPYSYTSTTASGDCGSLLFADDKQHSATIIGMHVAGVSNLRKGISAKITREFLEEYLRIADEQYEVEPLGEGENNLHLEPTNEVIANQVTLGRATPESSVPSRMTKTALVPSPLKDSFFVSPKEPSALWRVKVNGEVVDPLKIAREEYCPGVKYIPVESIEAAKESLLDWLLHNSSHGVEECKLTFQEAVVGIPGEQILSIPRKTSSGYPFNCTVHPTNKTYFFGDGDEFDLTNPRALALKEEVERCIGLMKNNIRPNFVFTDSLKDEKRLKEKVAAGKTRMFSGCPVVYTILCRMYFGRFAEWIIKNRVDNGIAIGVNQYSSEWDHAARKLNAFGTGANKGAGDFKGLDKNHLPQVQQASLDLINDWYSLQGTSEEDNHIRNMLGLDLVNSLHVNEGLFTYWCGATPSGHFLTALINSLDVHLYFRLSWIDLIRPKTLDAHEFNDMVYLLVLGDDNVFSVDTRYAHLFTEAALGPSMQKWNQTYTPETKDGELSDQLRNLEEIGFLKRKWVYDASNARYLAPLDLNTVLDIPNWIKKGGNAIGDTETNLDNCLAELALHGKEVYDTWWPKIFTAIQGVPGLSTPEITSYRLRLADTLRRDGSPYLLTRPLTDYDDEGINYPVFKPQVGRFGGQGGALFRVIARKPRWQPQQIPSTRGKSQRLAQCVVLLGAATQIEDKLGDSSTGRAIVTQDDMGQSSMGGNTTSSTADAGVVHGVLPYKPVSRDLLESAKTDVSNEIRAFLAKPKLIASGQLSTTDLFVTNKWGAWVPNDLINVAGDIWQNKLEGTLGFRGKLVLTVTVNGNRFQQGRYILAFCPTGGCSKNNSIFKAAHTATLTEVTQLPHVELDVNCDTEMTLEIPMVSASGWAPISVTSSQADFGAVGYAFLTAYSPLVAPAGASTANYTIFAHFEDVEFAMPTVPQSGRRSNGRVVKRRPAEIEASSAGIGPIESSAATIGTAARMLTGVPLLSSVAAPVSWVADLVRNAASAYGWSRPRNEGPAGYMSKQVMHRATNVDAQDNSTKLAYFDRNELGDMEDFAGSSVDEMAIQYLATISAYTGSTSWTAALSAGQLLGSVNLSPRYLYNTTSIASQTVAHTTPIAYLGNMFGLWRGGFRLTLKFVKTEFHSGRLAVVFQPNNPVASVPAPSFAKTQFLHREIVDIRMGNEFTFEFPYFGFTQYRPTTTVSGDCYSGTVYIYIVNSLVAPANVSSSINVIFEWSGTPDFEFAQPANPSGTPIVQFTPQIGRYAPQVGRSDCEIVSEAVGKASNVHPTACSETCIGERILSLRSILKKFSLVRQFTDPGTITNRDTFVFPHGVNVGQITTTPTYYAGTVRPDMFDRIAALYAFYRGGMRYKFFNADKATDAHLVAYSTPWIGSQTAGLQYNLTISDLDNLNRPFSYARGDAQGACEVEYPFYSTTPLMPIGDFLMNNAVTSPSIGYSSGFGPRVAGYCRLLDTSVDPKAPPLVFRSMAEDGSLGMFVSTIPLVGYTPSTVF